MKLIIEVSATDMVLLRNHIKLENQLQDFATNEEVIDYIQELIKCEIRNG